MRRAAFSTKPPVNASRAPRAIAFFKVVCRRYFETNPTRIIHGERPA